MLVNFQEFCEGPSMRWYEVKVIPFGFWIVDSCLAMKKHCWAAFHLEEHSRDEYKDSVWYFSAVLSGAVTILSNFKLV